MPTSRTIWKKWINKLLIEDKIDPKCPCTFMRLHRDATVVIEQKLADEIGYKG